MVTSENPISHPKPPIHMPRRPPTFLPGEVLASVGVGRPPIKREYRQAAGFT
jgi:hypothetical protein